MSCCVAPTPWLTVAGVTVTEPTGAVTTTVTVAVPVIPPLVALIAAVPADTAFTRPVVLAVATDALLVAHVTVAFGSTLPFASFDVAANCCVAPMPRLAFAGLSVTNATGAGGLVSVVVPLATLERAPNTAFTFRVPRNATNWN